MMNRLCSHLFFVCAIVFAAFLCSTTLVYGQPTEGIFRMGVISYGPIDTLLSNNPKYKNIMEDIRSELTYDFHFNEQGNMTVAENDSFIYREIFLEDQNLIMYMIENSENKWFCKDSALYQSDILFARRLDSLLQSPDKQESFKKRLQISRAPEDIKVIYGFPCIRVAKMDDTNPNKWETLTYYYESIRTVESLLLPKSISPGFPMEATEYFDGNPITFGVVGFSPESVENFFGIKLDQYQELNLREFATTAAQLGIKEMNWIFLMKLDGKED